MKTFAYILLLSATLPIACNRPSEKARTEVNPFADAETGDTLDAATRREMREAKGKTVQYIHYQTLMDRLGADSKTLELYLFWDTPDEATIQVLKRANNYPDILPSADLPINLTAVFTGHTEHHAQLNTLVREQNLAYNVLVLDEKDWAKLYTDFGSLWQGQLPVILAANQSQQLFHFFDHMPTLGELELVWQQAE